MDQAHRPDSGLSLLRISRHSPFWDFAGLEVEKAGNDLHVVLDPVVNLPEQDLFFPQGGLDDFFHLFGGR